MSVDIHYRCTNSDWLGQAILKPKGWNDTKVSTSIRYLVILYKVLGIILIGVTPNQGYVILTNRPIGCLYQMVLTNYKKQV